MRPIDADALIRDIIRADCVGGWNPIIQLIHYAPTIDPFQWIPAKERLPEPKKSVFISTKDWTGEGCYYGTIENHVMWKGYRWGATYWDDEVIAWTPLPEVYKESE